jgi:hypothetical protein
LAIPICGLGLDGQKVFGGQSREGYSYIIVARIWGHLQKRRARFLNDSLTRLGKLMHRGREIRIGLNGASPGIELADANLLGASHPARRRSRGEAFPLPGAAEPRKVVAGSIVGGYAEYRLPPAIIFEPFRLRKWR